MISNKRCFILHDQHPDVSGSREIDWADAPIWNDRGFGVFWVFNSFIGDRLAENLTEINAWYFEIDDLPKSQQLALIEKGLYPSLIVESKSSFHVYFFAKRASLGTWDEIQGRIIHHYGSDPKIKDPLRLLRAPGFKHVKNPEDPFEVKTIWHRANIIYPPEVMLYYFEELEKKENKAKAPRSFVTDAEMDLFELIYNMDHKSVLEAFSGSPWVNYERYTFKDNRNGKCNIIVNGKSSSCFIDSAGRIGAVGGGPTIWQWLKWFGHSGSTIRLAIKEVLGC